MHSVIAKQPKETRKQTTVALSSTVLTDLELYCQFIDSGRDWVVNRALEKIFRRDKGFAEWKDRVARNGNGTSPATPAQTQLPLTATAKADPLKIRREATNAA